MYQKILVPLDGSPLAECVLPHVDTIAKGCGVKEVTFLRVVESFYMPAGAEGGFVPASSIEQINKQNLAMAQDYLKRLTSSISYDAVKAQTKVVIGLVAESIADYAAKNGVDLIIIATHGRSGVSRWVWGSVAERVLRSACVPVLMVRAPGCAPGI